ncbi:sulfotransferase [Vibrio alfacsensis]|uniref:sulfotransferase n=1 Tax=Vibrio alfacsensis TaxID=1074311 RepID=UPI00406845BA
MSLIQYALSFRPRKTHVFCLGAAKTGTTSIAQIYNGVIRSAHEPEVVKTTEQVMANLAKTMSGQQCKTWLKRRDRRLNLELESSHPLGYLSPYLVELFPQAKFIVTIREPKSWLRSRVNFHLNKSPEEWVRYRNFIWSRHHQFFAEEETFLKESGLFSLDSYLKQYSEQYEIIFNAIPKERLLVIRTDQISNSVAEISRFINYTGDPVVPVHTNKLSDNVELDQRVGSSFIDEKIKQHCGWIKEAYF